ncbi:hypothetical protein BJX76DRAFT_356821 [Aspergillus varians]
MFRIFVDPDSLREDMAIERDLLPPPSCLAVLPVDSFGNIPPISFDPQASPESTTKCKQFQMGDHVETDAQWSITPNVEPSGDLLGQELQTSTEQYSHCHVDFPVSESTNNDLLNTLWSPSKWENSPHWKPFKIDPPSPEDQLTVDDIGPSNTGAPTPDLLHLIPRQSQYTVTSYFASEKVPETISASGQKESPQNDPMAEGNPCLVQKSDWTSDNSVFSSLFDEGQSPGTASVTTVTEKYTPATIDGTYNNSSVSPWLSLSTQVPWDAQQPNTTKTEDEVVWNDGLVYSDLDQPQGHFGQPSVTSDSVLSGEINGLPCIGPSLEPYVQPSSLLDTYGSTFPNFYLNTNAITLPEQNQAQYSSDNSAYQNECWPDDTTDSFFNTLGQLSYYQPSLAAQMTSWTNDARNRLLIEYKRSGLSYRDIKKIAGFKEAESTLRGRYRTLTKSKEHRVRRPQWHDNDIRLLCEGVNVYLGADRRNSCVSTCRSRRPSTRKIPWKKVAQYILANGGSYHFGNSTCKKKWCEVQNRLGG